MPPSQAEPAETRHASTVAIDGCAVLIQGPSGSGKSSLALQLMAHGGGLVADDVTTLWRRDGRVMAAAPPPLPPAIECRGIGLIRAELVGPAPVTLVVDLSVTETQRIPEPGAILLLGIRLPLLHRVDSVHFAAGILQYVRGQGIHPA
ncbi:HPr kinase/phosphorylase [Mangrovicoccus algicola]|uniref:Serine kinase n=1 Tax=Mangrovicoccus algicola TaxID=2771008 RepID=A0A8J7CXI0_9RHOB|nr:serine kinase [Mangrovicoccus algicola]MBE3638937.1 serine kinase [Mangrovicoccus algicola]